MLVHCWWAVSAAVRWGKIRSFECRKQTQIIMHSTSAHYHVVIRLRGCCSVTIGAQSRIFYLFSKLVLEKLRVLEHSLTQLVRGPTSLFWVMFFHRSAWWATPCHFWGRYLRLHWDGFQETKWALNLDSQMNRTELVAKIFFSFKTKKSTLFLICLLVWMELC